MTTATLPYQLKREAFATNRALEFFTESELRTQIGYGRDMWPSVLVKELIDNALDACEGAGIAPEILIRLDDDGFTVSDNGPGLPTKVVQQSLDYTVRVSDKKHYISPTRGQLGNALKCVWAAPFVVDGSQGKVEVVSCGERRTLDVQLDRVAQEPRISLTSKPFVQNGTSVKVWWPDLASTEVDIEMLDLYKAAFPTALESIVKLFALMNPHARFTLAGLVNADFPATVKVWTKWLGNQPTSPHWYTPEDLQNLIFAYIHQEQSGGRAITIREFVSEFDGLRRPQTQKSVTELSGLMGYLRDLVVSDDIQLSIVSKLLDAMKKFSRPIKAPRLGGLIGKEHIRIALQRFGIESGSRIEYQKVVGTGSDGLPHILEVAFGVRADKESNRLLLIGLNHSPTFQIPTADLSEVLSSTRVQESDPVVLFIHQVCPKFAFLGHGKGSVDDNY